MTDRPYDIQRLPNGKTGIIHPELGTIAELYPMLSSADEDRYAKLLAASGVMAETLKTLYLDLTHPETHESVRRGPFVALLQRTLIEATGTLPERERA